MTNTSEGKQAKEINQVHAEAILAETIKKEMKQFNLFTQYKLTPTMQKSKTSLDFSFQPSW
jgi:hypothetical protein